MSKAYRTLSLVVVFLSAGATAVSSAELTPNRAELKRMFEQSLREPPGRQVVQLMLTDGRVVDLVIEYLLTEKGIRKRSLADGTVCVTVDRRAAAVAGAAIDANIVCQQAGLCRHLPNYIRELARPSGAQTFFLVEEQNPSFHASVRSWSRTRPYAAAWLNAFENFISTFQLHEIGHVALNHVKKIGEPADATIAREAQADGFAVYISQLSGFANSPATALVVDALTGEADSAAPEFSLCRAEAFTLGLNTFAQKYFSDFPLILPDVQVNRRHGSNFDFSRALPQIAPGTSACTLYRKNFFDGVAKAAKLVTPQTRLESVNQAGRSCDRN